MKLPLSLILAATTISSVSAANFQRDDTASSVSAAASEKCNKDYRAILSNAPSPTPGPQFSAWLVTASGVRPSPTMQTEDMVDVAAMCTTSSDVNRAIEEAVSREPEDGQVRSQYEAWTASRDAWRSVLKPQFYRLGGWCGDVNAEVAGAMLYAVASEFEECTSALGVRFAEGAGGVVTATTGNGEGGGQGVVTATMATTGDGEGGEQGVMSTGTSTGGGVVETGCLIGVMGVVAGAVVVGL